MPLSTELDAQKLKNSYLSLKVSVSIFTGTTGRAPKKNSVVLPNFSS